MLDVVGELLKVEADEVVTITAPLDRQRPGNDGDRIRLRNLVAEARNRVLERQDGEQAGPLLAGLERAAADVDLTKGALGAVIVATPSSAASWLVGFPVRESVSLASTPATRFLIQGLRRSPRYRVLVVSDHGARLFDAVRDDAVEVQEHGFPFRSEIVPRDRRAVAGKFALAPGGDDKEQVRKFFRAVDEALAEAGRGDRLPLVLAGVKRSTALFEEVSRNARSIVGRLEGAYERSGPHDIGTAAWQVMREQLKERRRQVVAELADAVHAGRAVTGLDEAWHLAREGRGRLLVVEEDYRAEPCREVDGRLVPAPGEVGPDVMEDPVDELIEHVVRAGGEVEFVAADALAAYGRVGLMLR